MDNNTITKTTRKKTIIIVSIIIALLAILIIGFLIIFSNKSSRAIDNAELALNTDEDVISYLESKYKGESFAIINNESGKWRVQADKSGIIFHVENRESAEGNFYVAYDDYIGSRISTALHYFKSDIITAKLKGADNIIDVSIDGKPLNINSLSDAAKLDIMRLCSNIVKSAPFTTIDDKYSYDKIVIIPFEGDAGNGRQSLTCKPDADSFSKLLY